MSNSRLANLSMLISLAAAAGCQSKPNRPSPTEARHRIDALDQFLRNEVANDGRVTEAKIGVLTNLIDADTCRMIDSSVGSVPTSIAYDSLGSDDTDAVVNLALRLQNADHIVLLMRRIRFADDSWQFTDQSPLLPKALDMERFRLNAARILPEPPTTRPR